MEYKSVETQTQRIPTEFIKIETCHKLKFNRYYFATMTKTIFSIRAGKNEVIRKQIKPTQTGNKTTRFRRQASNIKLFHFD